jgi:hypothetical protein
MDLRHRRARRGSRAVAPSVDTGPKSQQTRRASETSLYGGHAGVTAVARPLRRPAIAWFGAAQTLIDSGIPKTVGASSGAGFIRAAIRKLLDSPAPTRRKLVVIALRLPNWSAHFYNELLGYRAAADLLDLTIRILVLRSAETSLAAALSAELVDDVLPPLKHITADEFLNQLIAFIHAKAFLAN